MGRAREILVGTRPFPSKKAALEEIRRIWNSYEVGSRVTNQTDELFLYNLVLMRSDPETKIGPGIDYFKIVSTGQPGPWERPEIRSTAIVWVDGTEVEFSAPKVLDIPPSAIQRLSGALANEAREVTGRVREEAFENPPVLCPLTGELMTDRSVAETRHLNPPLRELVVEFLADSGLTIGEIELENLQSPVQTDSGRLVRGLRVKDPTVRKQWIEFQKAHLGGLAVVHRNAPRA